VNLSSGTLTTDALTLGGIGTATLNLTGSGYANIGSGTGGVFIQSAKSVVNIGTGGVAGTLNAGRIFTGTGAGGTLNFNSTGTNTFAPQIAGAMTVNKLGPGRTILSGSNSYTGTTNINAGVLVAGGANAIAGSGAVMINNGGTLLLAGAGSITA
jgi:autotransporter-associated beta strand protein